METIEKFPLDSLILFSLREFSHGNIEIADKILPGFGEQMRQISLNFVSTAILSRQTAVIRKKTLIKVISLI